MKKLFPQKPEDLGAASTDELQGLLTEIATTASALREGTVDLSELGETDEERASEVIAQMNEAKELKAEITAILDERASAQGNFVTDVSDLAAELGAQVAEPTAEVEPEPEPEPVAPSAELAAESEPEPAEPSEPEPTEPEPAEPEAVPAALAPAEPRRYALPAATGNHQPQVFAEDAIAPKIRSVEGVEINGRVLKEGTELDRVSFMDAAVSLARRLGPVKHRDGGGEQRYSLASMKVHYEPEWTLIPGDADGNMQKLIAMGTPFLGEQGLEALVAAGGICAPPTPFYDPPGFASRERPVRDSLPTLGAPRGGVSIPGVNIVDRSDTGVTVIEEDEDAQGGTFAVKACRRVDCVEWTDTFVGIISHCLEVGNLNAITWPEGVALENDNLMAGWAATADTRLLNRIKALTVNVNAVSPYNAVHAMIYAVMRAKASIKSLLRAGDGLGYTALIPEWIPNLLVSDLAAQSANEERIVAESAIRGLLAEHNIRSFFYKDSPTTGVSQLFSAEVADSDLDNFPATAQIGVWINGHLARIDTGDLELGLVRDSSLNETNDYQLFGESFENVVRIGPEQAGRWINLDICPDGTFPALATALTC